MSKKLRNLALLGGLGAAAYMMGKQKGESETAAREPAPIEDATKRRKAVESVVEQTKETPKPAAKPTPKARPKAETKTEPKTPVSPTRVSEVPPAPKQRQEGVTASRLPREARGVEPTRSSMDQFFGDDRRPSAIRAREAMRTKEFEPLREGFKKGGIIKSSASKRADGCAQRGKTRGKMV